MLPDQVTAFFQWQVSTLPECVWYLMLQASQVNTTTTWSLRPTTWRRCWTPPSNWVAVSSTGNVSTCCFDLTWLDYLDFGRSFLCPSMPLLSFYTLGEHLRDAGESSAESEGNEGSRPGPVAPKSPVNSLRCTMVDRCSPNRCWMLVVLVVDVEWCWYMLIPPWKDRKSILQS